MTTTTPPSPASEEEAQHHHQQQVARNRLVEQHRYLVPFLAQRFQGVPLGLLEWDDLLQEGYLGLIRAVELYDPDKINPATGQPYRFSGYATWWIHAKMRRALATQARSMFTLPQAISQDLHRLKRVQGDLWVRLQREASPEELAAAMACPTAHILLLLDIHEVTSLDAPLVSADHDEEEAASLAEVVEAPDALPQQEQQAEISNLLSYLLPEEQRVIVCRYQLGQQTRYSIEDIPIPYIEVARQLQMTRERVKVVEERALRKMRYWAERPTLGKGK